MNEAILPMLALAIGLLAVGFLVWKGFWGLMQIVVARNNKESDAIFSAIVQAFHEFEVGDFYFCINSRKKIAQIQIASELISEFKSALDTKFKSREIDATFTVVELKGAPKGPGDTPNPRAAGWSNDVIVWSTANGETHAARGCKI